ncbi:shikimate dehydrogenase [Chloracidobacterium validum]|uniref:Shikimate dehydrogenase (NADP(+)) n=1 Tax=Chloracidobacterium validum TaxID=2821543 RepID=A0ABX8B6X2_9BACT|nr:shikimate dehydrogenase [Chloracidobacterium validum]QUW02711.1 shikimate dehydrogenase [Chloracidobacterium validum]
MICTPLAAETPEALFTALASADTASDWLELRLDALRDLTADAVNHTLRQALARRRKPVIATFRPREQGGLRDLTRAERLRFWGNALQTDADAFDIESDLIPHLVSAYPPDHPVWLRVVASHHDFQTTPADVTGFVAAHFPPYAGTIKLATSVERPDAVWRLFAWLTGSPQQPMKIPVGMGSAGILTRILGPAYGARWTYAASQDGRTLAPGQLPADELRHTFRLPDLNRHTVVAGLLGQPVGHSLSKYLHNAAFTHLGLNWVYIPVEVSPADLGSFVRDFIHPRTRRVPWPVGGYSVTLPHKVAVIAHLDQLTPTAERVGAVNTILIRDQALIGDNTDVCGALHPLTQRFELAGQPVAVLGAGGAAAAVTCGLVDAGAQVTVFARNPERGKMLGERFGISVMPLDQFQGRRFTGLVNTTPIGMMGYAAESEFPVSPTTLDGLTWVYDLIYRPRCTPLLQAASRQGRATLDGLPMLVTQAAAQFAHWTGQAPPETVLQAAAERALATQPAGVTSRSDLTILNASSPSA